jgi:hypothetical protein
MVGNLEQCRFCERDAVVRGMCRAHYMRERRYGDPTKYPPIGAPRRGSQLAVVMRRLGELGLGIPYMEVAGHFGYDLDALEDALEETRRWARQRFTDFYLRR